MGSTNTNSGIEFYPVSVVSDTDNRQPKALKPTDDIDELAGADRFLEDSILVSIVVKVC